jgi:septum formation protein
MSRAPESNRPRLILASASPRRMDILTAAGLRFEVQPSHVEEDFDPRLPPESAGPELAARKARAIAGRHAGADAFVIAADTLVALDPREPGGPWRYLGKPLDAEEARRFLGALSGTRHRVLTGVAVQRCRDGALFVDHAQTWVHMRALTPAEIEAYVESREWCGKAGGYAIQESADAFVTGLEGDFDTVVGLPLALTLRLLDTAGAGRWPGGTP